MSEEHNADGMEKTGRTPSVNRRGFVKSLGQAGAVGVVGTTGFAGVTQGARGNSGDAETNIDINELTDTESEHFVERVTQTAEFDTLAEFYGQKDFYVNMDAASVFSASHPSRGKRYVVNVPAETDDESIERVGITATIRKNDKMSFEGSWVIKPQDKADIIVTAKIRDGKVEMSKTSMNEPETTGNPPVTSQGLLPVGCSACKSVAEAVCVAGCGKSLGFICKLSFVGFLILRACKKTAKRICEEINNRTDACGSTAGGVCRETGSC